MNIDYLIKSTFGECGIDSKPSHGYYTVDCPNCATLNMGIPDGKRNLCLNFNNKNPKYKSKTIYHCWKCGISGSISKLFMYYATREQYNKYKEISSVLFFNDIKKSNNIVLPDNLLSYSELDFTNELHGKVVDYLFKERKLDESIFLDLDIRFCFEGGYMNRIIFISYSQKGFINYFVGRAFVDGIESYKNSWADKDTIIFNENKIDFNNTIFLTEGIFDYITIRKFNPLLMLGKSLSDLALEMIVSYKSNVIIAIDKDAFNRKNNKIIDNSSALGIKDLLDSYNIRNKILLLNDKDLSKMREDNGSEYVENYILDYKNYID